MPLLGRRHTIQMKKKPQNHKNKRTKIKLDSGLPMINPDAAGIDIGHREHWCAVPVERSAKPVERFGTFTEDLEKLADWLKECGIKTVAMFTGFRPFRSWSVGGLRFGSSMPDRSRMFLDAKPMSWTANGCNGYIATACSMPLFVRRTRCVCCAAT